jgi:hypothetical protein
VFVPREDETFLTQIRDTLKATFSSPPKTLDSSGDVVPINTPKPPQEEIIVSDLEISDDEEGIFEKLNRKYSEWKQETLQAGAEAALKSPEMQGFAWMNEVLLSVRDGAQYCKNNPHVPVFAGGMLATIGATALAGGLDGADSAIDTCIIGSAFTSAISTITLCAFMSDDPPSDSDIWATLMKHCGVTTAMTSMFASVALIRMITKITTRYTDKHLEAKTEPTFLGLALEILNASAAFCALIGVVLGVNDLIKVMSNVRAVVQVYDLFTGLPQKLDNWLDTVIDAPQIEHTPEALNDFNKEAAKKKNIVHNADWFQNMIADLFNGIEGLKFPELALVFQLRINPDMFMSFPVKAKTLLTSLVKNVENEIDYPYTITFRDLHKDQYPAFNDLFVYIHQLNNRGCVNGVVNQVDDGLLVKLEFTMHSKTQWEPFTVYGIPGPVKVEPDAFIDIVKPADTAYQVAAKFLKENTGVIAFGSVIVSSCVVAGLAGLAMYCNSKPESPSPKDVVVPPTKSKNQIKKEANTGRKNPCPHGCKYQNKPHRMVPGDKCDKCGRPSTKTEAYVDIFIDDVKAGDSIVVHDGHNEVALVVSEKLSVVTDASKPIADATSVLLLNKTTHFVSSPPVSVPKPLPIVPFKPTILKPDLELEGRQQARNQSSGDRMREQQKQEKDRVRKQLDEDRKRDIRSTKLDYKRDQKDADWDAIYEEKLNKYNAGKDYFDDKWGLGGDAGKAAWEKEHRDFITDWFQQWKDFYEGYSTSNGGSKYSPKVTTQATVKVKGFVKRSNNHLNQKLNNWKPIQPSSEAKVITPPVKGMRKQRKEYTAEEKKAHFLKLKELGIICKVCYKPNNPHYLASQHSKCGRCIKNKLKPTKEAGTLEEIIKTVPNGTAPFVTPTILSKGKNIVEHEINKKDPKPPQTFFNNSPQPKTTNIQTYKQALSKNDSIDVQDIGRSLVALYNPDSLDIEEFFGTIPKTRIDGQQFYVITAHQLISGTYIKFMNAASKEVRVDLYDLFYTRKWKSKGEGDSCYYLIPAADLPIQNVPCIASASVKTYDTFDGTLVGFSPTTKRLVYGASFCTVNADTYIHHSVTTKNYSCGSALLNNKGQLVGIHVRTTGPNPNGDNNHVLCLNLTG